jgi:hypothetical protein
MFKFIWIYLFVAYELAAANFNMHEVPKPGVDHNRRYDAAFNKLNYKLNAMIYNDKISLEDKVMVITRGIEKFRDIISVLARDLLGQIIKEKMSELASIETHLAINNLEKSINKKARNSRNKLPNYTIDQYHSIQQRAGSHAVTVVSAPLNLLLSKYFSRECLSGGGISICGGIIKAENVFSYELRDNLCKILYENNFFKSEQEHFITKNEEGYYIIDDEQLVANLKLEFLIEQLKDLAFIIACENVIESIDFEYALVYFGRLDTQTLYLYREDARDFKRCRYLRLYLEKIDAERDALLCPWVRALTYVVVSNISKPYLLLVLGRTEDKCVFFGLPLELKNYLAQYLSLLACK